MDHHFNNPLRGVIESSVRPCIYLLADYDLENKPKIASYAGGSPYFEEKDSVPICRSCNKPLGFLSQIYMPFKSKERELFVNYICLDCYQHEPSSLRTKSYLNPSEGKMADFPILPIFQKQSFFYDLDYSIPSFDVFQSIAPKVFSKLELFYGLNDFEEEFEEIRWDILGRNYELSSSFIGGYPTFNENGGIPTSLDIFSDKTDFLYQIGELELISNGSIQPPDNFYFFKDRVFPHRFGHIFN